MTLMKHNTLFFVFIAAGMMASCQKEYPGIDYDPYIKDSNLNYDDCKLVWSEEFEEDGLPDETVWDYESGYKRNYELQDYKKDEKYARVEDGKLIIEAHADVHETDGRQFEYSSASLHTKNKKGFKYGRIDIAAKIPVSRGMYPTFWMLPVEETYGSWPNSGQMDIMAYTYGSYWGTSYEKNTITSRIYSAYTESGGEVEPGTGSVTTMENTYHLYSIAWKKKRIQFLLDNNVIFTYDKRTNTPEEWPFDKEFYLLLSLAVGGTEGGAFGVDETGFPKRMEIDYIRYYEWLEDDETDEVVDPNLVKNSGFEKDFEEGMEPTYADNPNPKRTMDYIDRWFARSNGNRNTVSIDSQTARAGKRSLKVASTSVANVWDIELSYPIADVERGRYTFSFWMKTNQESAPFAAHIMVCETEEDLNIEKSDRMKAVKMKSDGTQEGIFAPKSGGGQPYSAIFGKTMTTEWQKYSVTVDLPECVMVKLLIRPYASCSGDQWYTAFPVENSSFWVDDVTFEKID